MKTLAIIDPQKGFCDPNEAMFVRGSVEDTQRLADFIDTKGEEIDNILVSRDKHPKKPPFHISQARYWVDARGNHPPAYTKLSLQGLDIIGSDGRRYTPANEVFLRNTNAGIGAIEYLFQLRRKGRTHTIWPDHCVEGTESEEIVEVLQAALDRWESKTKLRYRTIVKGESNFVEFYSAFRAEVIDPMDNRTKLNASIIDYYISDAVEVLWSGQALSHCLRDSIEDAFAAVQGRPNWTVFMDTTSSIAGYEQEVESFITDYSQLGIKFGTTKEWNG
jgi:nicotinamidase/pyrazinamidase